MLITPRLFFRMQASGMGTDGLVRITSVDSTIDEPRAKVAELADAPDLGSGGETHEGSSPSFRTNGLNRKTPELTRAWRVLL